MEKEAKEKKDTKKEMQEQQHKALDSAMKEIKEKFGEGAIISFL